MFSLIYDTIKEYKRNWRPFLTFTILYMLMSSFLILPLLNYFLNRILLYISSGVLLNTGAFKILLDFKGLLGVFFLMVLAISFVLIELGTLVVMVQKIQTKEPVLISEGVMTSLHFIVRALGFGLLPLAVLLLLFAPLIKVPYMPDLASLISLPPIFLDTLMSRVVTKGLYYGLLAFLAYILLRSIFVLHEILIEKKGSISAIKSSFFLTKRISIGILIKLLIFDVLIFLLGSVFFVLLARMPELLGVRINYLIQNQFLRFSSVLALLFTLMLLPLNVIFITKLYNKVKGYEVVPLMKVYNLDLLRGIELKGIKTFNTGLGTLFAFGILALTVFLYVGNVSNDDLVFAGRDVELISHRGIVDGEFENSLAAIRASLEADIDAVGMDVQLTKDEVIVLSHDRTLERTFGLPHAIHDHTYAELMALEVDYPWNFNSEDPILPTLDEVLKLIKGEMKIHIDVKTFGKSQVFSEKIVALVNEHEMHDFVYIQSFDYEFLKRVRALDPEIKICQIMYFALGDLGSLDVDYFTVHSGMLSNEFVRKAKQLDKGIWVWTINTLEGYREALRYDIDGVITDYPLLLKYGE